MRSAPRRCSSFPRLTRQASKTRWQRAREFIARWKGHPLIVPAVAPHAPYTCTTEILRSCAELACEFDVPLAHAPRGNGVRGRTVPAGARHAVVPWVKKQRLFDARVLAAHCVHVDEGEIRTLKDAAPGSRTIRRSNLKLGSGVAPVARMLELGVAVGIGTDGAASNNDLDMFEEMRLAALLAKGISGDPTALPARQALAMATRSARARCTLATSPARSSRASAPISSWSTSISRTTCRASTAIRTPFMRSWCMRPRRPTSSTSCAMGDG